MTATRRPRTVPSTARVGIPEKPLTGQADCPKVIFALALRALRDSIGKPPYSVLAKKVHFSKDTLSRAANGKRRPTWEVSEAYVQACGGDVDHFKQLYRRLFGSRR